MTKGKKLEVVFVPGCFDSFDGTQEELDGLLADIKKMAEDGTLEENLRSVDFDELHALELAELGDALEIGMADYDDVTNTIVNTLSKRTLN